MARYQEQFIQQVLQTTDIIELISKYVTLKKKGREFVGLCPFHDDSNPSMTVSPAKQIYKCFSCGSGGNALQFVMNFEKQSFPEAIKTLAEMNAIPLPKESAGSQPVASGMGKSDLLKVTAFANEFFKRRLTSPEGKAVLKYARDRGLNDETIDRFDIGFAPDKWDALITAAHKRGFTSTQLVAAGLCKRKDGGGEYDYFRNRLIFPIKDASGRTVAFGGRAMSDNDRAKYLNSPQGTLYDKSSMLYPMDIARKGISESGCAVVVEGYLDALMPHQAGINNVVATLGTSLTDRHVRLLSRFAREAVLIFDADVAGAMAAERAIELFMAQRLHIRVAEIPFGKDPCDYVIAEGGPAMKKLIEDASDAIEYVWNRRYSEFEDAGTNLSRRNEIVDEFLQLIIQSTRFNAIDSIRRQNLTQHIAHLLNISETDIQKRMKKIAPHSPPGVSGRTPEPSQQRQIVIPHGPEREVIEILLHEPALFTTIMERIDPGDFEHPVLSRIAECVWILGEEDRLSIEEVMGQEDMVEFGSIIAEMAIEVEHRDNHEKAIIEATNQLLGRREIREYEASRTTDVADNLSDIQNRIRQAHANDNNVLRKFRGIGGN